MREISEYCLSHLLPVALSMCFAQEAREWKLFPKMNAALRDKKSKAGNGKNNGNNEVRRNKSLLRVVHSY